MVETAAVGGPVVHTAVAVDTVKAEPSIPVGEDDEPDLELEDVHAAGMFQSNSLDQVAIHRAHDALTTVREFLDNELRVPGALSRTDADKVLRAITTITSRLGDALMSDGIVLHLLTIEADGDIEYSLHFSDAEVRRHLVEYAEGSWEEVMGDDLERPLMDEDLVGVFYNNDQGEDILREYDVTYEEEMVDLF